MTTLDRTIRALAALALLVSTSGCFLWESDDDDSGDQGDQTTPSFSYSTSEANLFETVEIAPITTSLQDLPSDAVFRVDPAFPLGLDLDSTTGDVTGTPEEVHPRTEHVVRAVRDETNSNGATFEVTLHTETLTVQVFEAVAPENLSYSLDPATYGVNTTIPPNVPSLDGHATQFVTSTPLPTGLSISPTTGVITGRPTAESPPTDYVVTASNPFGSTDATLTIAIGTSGMSGLLTLDQSGTVSLLKTQVNDRLLHRTYRTVPGSPTAGVSTPDGRFLYVASDTGEIVRFTLSDGAARPDSGVVVGTATLVTRMLVDTSGTRLVTLGSGALRSFEILGDGTLGTEESLAVSFQSFAMDLNPANGLVHLLDSGAAAVSTFTLTPSLASAGPDVTVSGYPAHIAVAPDGANVFVADVTGDRLIALEVVQNPQGGAPPLVQRQSLAVDDSMSGIATADRRLFVSRFGGGGLQRLRIESDGTLTTDIVLEDGVSFDGVVANPNGRTVFALDETSDEVYAFDSSNSARRARIQVRSDAFRLVPVRGPTLYPRTEWVLATDPSTSTVSAMSIEYGSGVLTPSVQGPVATGSQPLDVVMNEARTSVYVANSSADTVSRFAFDAATGSLSDRTDTPTGSLPLQIALDPSEQFLWVMHRGEESFQRLDVAPDGTLSPGPVTVTTIGPLATLAVLPTGRALYAVSDSGTIAPYVIDASTGAVTASTTTSVPGVLGDIEFPNEARFAYVADSTGFVWQFAIDADDGTLTDLVPNSVATGATTTQLAISRSAPRMAGANLEDGDVTALRYDRDTGLLSLDPQRGPFAVFDNPLDAVLDVDATYLYVVNDAPGEPSLRVWCWVCSGFPTERSSYDAGSGAVAVFTGSGLSD